MAGIMSNLVGLYWPIGSSDGCRHPWLSDILRDFRKPLLEFLSCGLSSITSLSPALSALPSSLGSRVISKSNRMPEEHWQAHGGIPACDLCHSRKVKCDRKDPCGNCETSRTECLRTRQKRHRPRVRANDKIRALVDRLSNLEKSVLVTPRLPNSPSPSRDACFLPEYLKDTGSFRNLKRKSSTEVPSRENPVLHTGSRTPQISTIGSPDFIRKELSDNDLLSVHQRSVLETAISFVDLLGQAASNVEEGEGTAWWTKKVPTDLTPSELMQIILANQSRELDTPQIQLHTLDHIPPKTVERMGLALIEGTADVQTLNMYKVVIHFKAAVVLYASLMEVPQGPAVREATRNILLHHLSAAFTALDQVSFLTPPTLLLLQVLLTGALLMQVVGNPSSCWALTAHASRTLVALGYNNISSGAIGNTDHDEEIKGAVAWCFYLDKTMSLLLLRPSSLPPLNTVVSSLIKFDSWNPFSVFAFALLEMVPIHDEILQVTLDPSRRDGSKLLPSSHEEISRLQKKMAGILTMVEKARPLYLYDPETNADIRIHWQSLEFKCFSTLTAILRLSPTVASNPLEREECLQSARKALECVKIIQELAKKQGHFIEEYNPYLAWTVLSYPLCPFFVVFCNVVGTSNPRDFQLLQDVVDGVSSLLVENKFIDRLQRLCNTLLDLCRPLMQTPSTQTQPLPSTQFQISNTNPTPPDIGENDLNDDGMDPRNNSFPPSSWDDEMMWQLFQCQPSLEWFNSDILDPSSWDFSLPN